MTDAARPAESTEAGGATYRPRLREVLLVVSAHIVGVIVLTWPLARQLNTAILGAGGDALGAISWIWRSTEMGLPYFGETAHLDTGAPFGWREGNGANVVWSLVSFPTVLVAKITGEIPAYNLMILFALASAGVAMYFLVRRLGGGPWAAAWGALVFTVFPWHLEKAQGHGALATIYLFPLLLLVGYWWYEQPSRRRAVGLGLVNLGMWLIAGYFGIVASIGTLALLALAAHRHSRIAGRARAVGAVAMGTGAVVIAAVIVLAAIRAGSGPVAALPTRTDAELSTYGARLSEFLLPSYRNVVVGDELGPDLVGRLHGSNPSESTLTIGWLTLLLALAFVVLRGARRRHALAGSYAGVILPTIAVVGVLCALPSPLSILGTGVTAPSGVIHELVPTFRVPTRFMPLIIGCLIPAAALMLNGIGSWVRTRLARRPAVLRSAAVAGVGLVALALSFAELSTSPPAVITPVGTSPPEYVAAKALPPGILAEYPLVPPAQATNSDYLFWQRVHRRPLLTGAGENTFADTLRDSLVNPATPGTAATLAMLGVGAVIVHPGPPTPGAPIPRQLGPGLEQVAATSTGATVWRVTASPASAFATFSSGFAPAEIPAPRRTAHWMGDTGSITLFARRAGRYEATFTVASYGRERTLRIRGAKEQWQRAGVRGRITLQVELPEGFSRLAMQASPGPQSLPDGRSAALYVDNWLLTQSDARADGRPDVTATAIPAPRDLVAALPTSLR